MSRLSRSAAILSISLAFACAFADKAYVTVSAYPSIAVADGKSTVTISAELRDGSGKTVPDGTRVFFATTLGSFRESVVQTTGGVARAILIAGGIPGTAKLTVTGVGVDVAPTTLDFDFVGDRSDLSTAMEYVEIVAPSYMQYTADTRIIGAAAPEKGVYLRYRDIEIDADDIQYSVNNYELRARRATLKMGKWSKDFDQLFLRLDQHKGLGLTSFRGKRADTVVATGRWISFMQTKPDGSLALPEETDRFGLVEITRGGYKPATGRTNSSTFAFADLSESPSTISARKAIVVPRKEVQFQRAEVYVAGAKVLKLPLYQVRLNRTAGPMVTDDFVSVNDNQLALNYPYYVSLEPGLTSLFRFHTGNSQSRGSGGSQGMFLDYEMAWNRGDEMQGSLTFSGIARNDWIASLRHYMRFDDQTSLNAQVDVPGGRSLYGSTSLFRQFEGFQASLNANLNKNFRGNKYSREMYTLEMEKDPTKVGKLPLRLYYGLTAENSRYSSEALSEHQTTYGLRMRLQSLPLSLDSKTQLAAGASVSRLFGSSLEDGVAIMASAALSRQINSSASIVATYDFTRDGFNDLYTGQHQLTLQGYYGAGRTNLSFVTTRSLDIDRMNFYGDFSYRLSGLWRLASGYTYDRYYGDPYFDYNLSLGYRIGWREIGLTWSRRTNRIGVQLLGASF
ncbi:MAG TPA: Ig-like domain-containing protein [Fimbriimonas sp.]